MGSFKGRMKAIGVNGRFVGGIRERTVIFAKMRSASIRKAQIRTAQPKPTFGIKRTSIMGKMTPPKDDPAATRPIAAPRFLSNHVDV